MAKLPRSTANDFDPAVMRLFDQYVHGDIDRRGFLDKAAKFAVGGLTAAGLLAAGAEGRDERVELLLQEHGFLRA